MKNKITLRSPILRDDGFKEYRIDQKVCKILLEKGEIAIKNTYPVSNQGYSVAVLTEKGNVYTGASYTSDAHNSTMHGEAVALAFAAQYGEISIVAITGPNCHNCKQLIWESSIRSKIDTLVIIEEQGKYLQIPISKLMPYPWPDKEGNKS